MLVAAMLPKLDWSDGIACPAVTDGASVRQTHGKKGVRFDRRVDYSEVPLQPGGHMERSCFESNFVQASFHNKFIPG